VHHSLNLDWLEMDHMEFDADGHYLIAVVEVLGDSWCESFELKDQTVVGYWHVGGKPRTSSLDPEGNLLRRRHGGQGTPREIDADRSPRWASYHRSRSAWTISESGRQGSSKLSNRGGLKNDLGRFGSGTSRPARVVVTWPIRSRAAPTWVGCPPTARSWAIGP